MEEKLRIYSGKKYYNENASVGGKNGIWSYSYKYSGQKTFWARTDESPKDYNNRINPKKNIENIVTISYKGKLYSQEDLDLLSKILLENYAPKNNHSDDIIFDPNEELSEEKFKELKDWETKMKASSWKSRQRSLRKKGKLEQYKIDSLNKLGMLWNPRESIWEKMYLIYKKDGLCDEIEDWVNEQRELHSSNKLSSENLIRLELVKFPFKEVAGEEFPLTFNSLNILEEKLRKKTRRLELKLFNDPPKKLTDRQKEIIKKEKNYRKEKRKKKERNQKSKWSILRSKYVSSVNKFNKDLDEITFDKAIEIINSIQRGESMYYSVINDFIKKLISEKKFTKYSLTKANISGHFFGNSYYETAFLDEHKIFINSPIDESIKYNQITEFFHLNNFEINCYACVVAINYFAVFGSNKTKKFEPVEILINIYKQRQEINNLSSLKGKIKKFPLLFELYENKIDKVITKLLKK
jgi:hypothetical protein